MRPLALRVLRQQEYPKSWRFPFRQQRRAPLARWRVLPQVQPELVSSAWTQFNPDMLRQDVEFVYRRLIFVSNLSIRTSLRLLEVFERIGRSQMRVRHRSKRAQARERQTGLQGDAIVFLHGDALA